MDKIIIRKIQKPDLLNFDGLCNPDNWYYPQVSMTPQALLTHPEYMKNCFVAYHDDILVGYIYGGVLCDTLYPQFMFVKESYRKNGIGAKLLTMLEENSKCSVSIVYYNKELSNYYCSQDYDIGTNLEVAIKQLGGETNETEI